MISMVFWWHHLSIHICVHLSKTENGHNSMESFNKEVRLCTGSCNTMLKAAWTAHFFVCLQVYRQGGIQSYVSRYWYVMEITWTILLPYLVNENPTGLYIMDQVCVWKPLSKQFYSITTKTKVWILSCASLVKHLCNYLHFWIHRHHPPYTSDEYKRKPVRSPCTVKSFWLWIRRTSTH
jgi:hypothetical protein